MKHGAITFAFLLVAGTAGALAFTGCSDDPAQQTPAPDTGVADTGLPDTRPPPDTNPPPVITCAAPLGSDFMCEDAEPKVGKTVCTDQAINDIVAGCFGDTASSSKCSAAQTKYAQCSNCFLKEWTYGDAGFFDTGACIKSIDAASTCGKTWRCNIDCLTAVCGECDPTEGTGKKGGTTSEQDDCWSDAQAKGGTTKPKGACYDVATKDYSACAGDTKFAPCFVRSVADVTAFARGSCRDGAKWDKVYEELPVSDAGTDAAGDTTPADTAMDDTAPADTTPADTTPADTTPADTTPADTATDDTATDAATD